LALSAIDKKRNGLTGTSARLIIDDHRMGEIDLKNWIKKKEEKKVKKKMICLKK